MVGSGVQERPAMTADEPLRIAKVLRRLEISGALPPGDRQALETLPIEVRAYPAYADIVREGERPTRCCLVLAGWVCRTKTAAAGSRMIVSLHIPGDMPDLQSLHLD